MTRYSGRGPSVRLGSWILAAFLVAGCGTTPPTAPPSGAASPQPAGSSSPSAATPAPAETPASTPAPTPSARPTPTPTPDPASLLAGTHRAVSSAQLLAIDPGAKQIAAYQRKSLKAWGTWEQPPWPSSALAESLWLCQSSVAGATAAERLVDRETGCLLALAHQWATSQYPSIRPMDEAPAGTLESTRAIYDYAATALGAKGRAFIDGAIKAGLGSPATAAPAPTGLRSFKTIRALGPKSVAPVVLLTAVRDAWSANLGYRLRKMTALGDFRLAKTVVDMAPLLGQAFSRTPTRDPSWPDAVASVPYLCAKGFPGEWNDSLQWRHCEMLVYVMWDGYRQTGSKAFYDAAALAYREGLVMAARSGEGFPEGGSALTVFKQDMRGLK